MYPDRATITERLKEVGATSKVQLAKVHRIVERGNRAALLIDQRAWITMVKEGGEWKSGTEPGPASAVGADDAGPGVGVVGSAPRANTE